MLNKRPDDMARITTPELAKAFIDEQVKEIQEQVGNRKVLLPLSGGVDSSVVAALLIKAIGKNLVCVHVNHGLLRKGEPEQVVQVFRNEMDANLVYVDAVDRFLNKLEGVSEPEKKRKIIGAEFIRVFEEEARKLEGIDFLAQGTIYPDILESGPVKAHHNVGGLPDDLQFELVEPLRLLYKDEVRVVGKALGLPDDISKEAKEVYESIDNKSEASYFYLYEFHKRYSKAYEDFTETLNSAIDAEMENDVHRKLDWIIEYCKNHNNLGSY